MYRLLFYKDNYNYNFIDNFRNKSFETVFENTYV